MKCFRRVIEVYQRTDSVNLTTDNPRTRALDGTPMTTTQQDGQQFPNLRVVGMPWFIMSAEGGVRNGELQVQTSEFDSDFGAQPIYHGDTVVFKALFWDDTEDQPADSKASEIAKLIVTGVSYKDRVWTFKLCGESIVLDRPVGWVNEYGRLKGYAWSGVAPGEIVDSLFNIGGVFYDYGLRANWFVNRNVDKTITGNRKQLGYFETVGNESGMDVLKTLAMCLQAGSTTPAIYGISNTHWWDGGNATGWLYFCMMPDVNELVMTKHAATIDLKAPNGDALVVLNRPSWSESQFYNAVEVTTHYNESYTIRDDAAVDWNFGITKMYQMKIQSIRDYEDLNLAARSFLARHAKPRPAYDEFQVLIQDAGQIPLPWRGGCRIHSNMSDDGDLAPIRHVKLLWGTHMVAEISLGDVERTNPFIAKNGRVNEPGVPFAEAIMRMPRNDFRLPDINGNSAKILAVNDDSSGICWKAPSSITTGTVETGTVVLAKISSIESSSPQRYTALVLSLVDKSETETTLSGVMVADDTQTALAPGDVVSVFVPSVARLAAGEHPFVMAGTGSGSGTGDTVKYSIAYGY